jgi:leader peptidase (prepilin peptidase)/N-methyltransferase
MGIELVLGVLVGLAFGQLLDLAFARFFSDEPAFGPLYRCQRCQLRARPIDFVPLAGYVAGVGRCPECRQALPLRSLVLPLGAAGLFAASYLVFDELGPALLGGLFATVFLTLTLTDLERGLLPNRIVYPSILLAAALCWGWPDNSVPEVLGGGAVAVVIAGLLLLVSLPFGRGAFGMGDVKMIVLIGFVTGLPSVLIGIFVGTIAAAAAAAFLIITGLRSRRDYLPHGPFLALGAVVALFWGSAIWDWYRG